MRGSFKFGLGLGVLVLMASAAPACSSSDDSGSGGKHTGGTGGGGTGGATGGAAGSGGSTGGAAGSGGTAGSGGGVTCGGDTCQSYLVGGLLTLAPCCSTNNKCGSAVDSTTGQLIGVPAGCYEIGQVGNDDTTCPKLDFTNPLDGGPGSFDGCCNHATSKCGYKVDISSVGGPDFGCIDSAGITDAPQSCTPTTSDAGTDGAAGAAGGGGTAGATSDASAD